ncbi:MAG: MFS transporter [Myxococcales bacterium]|nr:MFS transporter [Myxococcales bacterium]
MQSRAEIIEANLDRLLREATPAARRKRSDEPLRPGGRLCVRDALALFEDQVASRVLDVVARELKQQGLSYYTISSAGHEQNAALGALLRPTDPCFLHYRSGALMMARSRFVPDVDPILDSLLSLCASADDPIAGGRHKVWGSRDLWVPPQTSTVGSHLPKAMGTAFALGRARRLGIDTGLPDDAITVCSFGDASSNQAVSLAGINAARFAQRCGSPVPVLFVCEDNGIGISVETPARWIEESFGHVPYLRYLRASGAIDDVWEAVADAIDTCRTSRSPVFLHLDTVRLLGHAGSDVETQYHSLEEIEETEARDPLLANARRLIETGAAKPAELAATVAAIRSRARELAREVVTRPKLVTRAEVMSPLGRYDANLVRASAEAEPDARDRSLVWSGRPPEEASIPARRTLAAYIGAALSDEMIRRPEMLVFGEDVGRKGGVYGVTNGLQARFGSGRVFDTLLDETSILGVAQGAGLVDLLPVPEIQYLAYLHNALDQLRGEACSLSFFSAGQYSNPMVVRVAGLAFQKGFGGHFHNDNSIGALRDIPDLMLVTPSRGDDAARLLRGALAVAKECGRVVVFLEPIALYHEKDLYETGDGRWLFDYPTPGSALLPGELGVYFSECRDVLLVSYANGLRFCLRAARRLAHEHGVRARVIDLRWLAPLDIDGVAKHAAECEGVLVVDECRATGGGVADAIVAGLVEGGVRVAVRSVRSADSYVPLGPATDAVLLGEDQIVAGALALCEAGAS